MPSTPAQAKARRAYAERSYDRIEITVPKGSKAALQAAAAASGYSLNALVARLLEIETGVPCTLVGEFRQKKSGESREKNSGGDA